MIASIPMTQPFGTAVWQKARWLMDVILHIGAHRCATTSFQHYMRIHKEQLSAIGIGFWGPLRTRSGLFRGLLPGPDAPCTRDAKKRALGRVRLQCKQSAASGVRHLVVSDENMVGTMRANLRLASLYSGAGERVARFAEAFDGSLTDIILNIRNPETYWSSLFGYYAEKGRGVPRPALLARIAFDRRAWRNVISEVSLAAPGVRVHVLPFETFASRPDAQLALVSGQNVLPQRTGTRCNATLDLEDLRNVMEPSEGRLPAGAGRWIPFDDTQRMAMREAYSDDLLWLAAGADGTAQLASDPNKKEADTDLPIHDMIRGRRDDGGYGKVAQAGRSGTAW